MRRMILITTIGAVLGGVYPGAFIAFIWTCTTGSETICFVTNLLLGVSGAFLGMQTAKAFQPQNRFPTVQIIFPLFLGLMCGIIGYLWADWAISHAEPPL